ncbi:MAG TPA: metallophosphoesterase [Pseudogracilibacillus sp.]|nr:metallophosphoesterase [Pseudogracilibacillus sp.]
MTKLLVLSDSHGLTRRITTIYERHDVTEAIHCGDSELALDAKELEPFHVVRGNCDFESRFPEEKVIEMNGLRIFATHGHLYGVKSSLMRLQYRATEVDADIVLFGHSHVAYCEEIDGKLYINPGSLRQPRHWPDKSYCLIHSEDRTAISVLFYQLDGKELNYLPYEKHFHL